MNDVKSGEVPRTLYPGVVWDSAAEDLYQANYERFTLRGMNHEQAEREARWAVEISLSRRHVGEQVRAAVACRTNADKRTLYRWWVQQFGKARADRLAACVKNEKSCKEMVNWQ